MIVNFYWPLKKKRCWQILFCGWYGSIFYVPPFLLTAAAFDLAEQIPGAMCPIGTFNANVYGFPLLLVRLWGVFLCIDMACFVCHGHANSHDPFSESPAILDFISFLLDALGYISSDVIFYFHRSGDHYVLLRRCF